MPNFQVCEFSPNENEMTATRSKTAPVWRAALHNTRQSWRALFVVAAMATLAAPVVVAPPADAQGFKWPWEVEDEPRRPPPRQAPEPYQQQQGDTNAGGWSARSSICIDLERRLVQETSNSAQGRDVLPAIEAEIRKLRQSVSRSEAQLERSGCFEEFLFTRSLRRTPKCLGIARQRDDDRQRLSQLEQQRQDLNSRSSHSYQDEIIQELARNNCGATYAQEANRRRRDVFSPFWNEQEGGSGYANSYKALPFATYRTLCVRMCDGYYFPVSFSTLPNHFSRDAEACQSRCAAPATLYYHQNPGAGVEQMVSVAGNEPYTQLKEAFLYRKKYVDGCSCKQSEYLPQTPVPSEPVPAVRPDPGDRAENQNQPQLSPFR